MNSPESAGHRSASSDFPREPAQGSELVHLPERCNERLCYTQRTAATGERVFGHFIVEARVLADAVWQQIDAPVLTDTRPADIALHRWLCNAERDDDQTTALPSAQRDLESTIEHLFTEGRARVFCACCNRNVARHEVVLDRPNHLTSRVATRYFCPEGHLLLGVETGRFLVFAEKSAA